MKNYVNKIFRAIRDPDYRFQVLASRGFYNRMSDEEYLKRLFKASMGYPLNLDDPQTFNEKLQWLKLYDRRPEYTTMVDKYAVKKYVSDMIGEEYIIPVLGVWDSFNDIDFDTLPDQFVLKTTHDSGGIYIVDDKAKLDVRAARKKINWSLNRKYYYWGREWPYKNVKPRIFAEKYMVDESGYELKDYKFFCFNGKAKIMFIAADRNVKGEETKFDFYDMNFNRLNIVNGHPNSERENTKPRSFEKMKELAEILSKDIPHARIDFYDISGKTYFGEITFSHWSGMVPFQPVEWDCKLGELIILPQK